MGSSTFTPQHEVARSLGLSLEQLKKLRDEHLTPGDDWQPGRPIQFLASGIQKIRAALGLPLVGGARSARLMALRAGADTDTGAPAQKKVTVRVQLVVIRPARGNKRIVLCRTTGGSDERAVRLRVKDNANFTPGLVVPRCVQSNLSAELYDMEGRLPRWKGRF